MTDLEKLEARIEAVNAAIASVKTAMSVDRNIIHAKHYDDKYINALIELTDIQSSLNSLRIRMIAIGR